ncbi:MAG: head-tail joining protein [Burkholderiales bacterium]
MAPTSLPLRINPAKRLLPGALFRRPHFAPYYYPARAFLPSAAPVAAPPASLPLRLNPSKRLLAGKMFRRAHFAPCYRRRLVLPSAPPAVAPASLPLRFNPAKRLLPGALFRRPPVARYYRARAFLQSLTPAVSPPSLPLRINPIKPLLGGKVFRRRWQHYRPRRFLLLPSAPAAPVALLYSEDLSVFFQFADFALEASWTPSAGGAPQTAQVLLDAPDEQLLEGAVQSRDYAITYAVTQLTGLKPGETLSVDGVSYTVREVAALDDGAVLRATLTKP